VLAVLARKSRNLPFLRLLAVVFFGVTVKWFIVMIFLWCAIGPAVAVANALRANKVTITRQQVGKGLLAIVVWISCVVFVEWVKRIGWLVYLLYALPAALVLSLLNPRTKQAFGSGMIFLFEILDEHPGWILGFLGCLAYGGLLYFLLYAPFGVLCSFGLRPCGS
jgi:hypothetical protein